MPAGFSWLAARLVQGMVATVMAAVVMRCDEGEPYVPSRVVQCARCGADCWLSEKTGDSTLALASATGDAEINCMPCFEARLELEMQR